MRDDIILWEVDTQADFMLPGGKLYVPGAERLLPNIRRLTDAARHGHVLLISHGCIHTPDDPEFQTFPPHCVEGTEGAKFVSEAFTEKVAVVPNPESASLPDDFSRFHKLHLPQAHARHLREPARAIARRPPPAPCGNLRSGVVTEYCVRLRCQRLARSRPQSSVVTDAIETLNPEESRKTLAELPSLRRTLSHN